MHLRIVHRTTFTYAGEAHDSFNEVRLRPLDDATQRCRNFKLRITPAAASRAYADDHGNIVHVFVVAAPHPKLVVEAESRVETTPLSARPPVPAVSVAKLRAARKHDQLGQFLSSSPCVPLDAAMHRAARTALGPRRRDVWRDVCRLGRHIFRRFAYRPRTTGIHTNARDVLKLRAGVCQDFAHVHLGFCRALGIPARYVSGYFLNPARRPREIEASHAWIEAWVPGHGWAAFDPTHDRVPDDRYVKVAVGRDYQDISPVSGWYSGAATRSLRVSVAVREINGKKTRPRSPKAISRA